jgi:SOS response regulatory protein OraA/RecX
MSSDSENPEQESNETLLRRARFRAISYIGIAAKTSGAVYAKLLREGFPNAIIKETVIALDEEGYIKNRVVAMGLFKGAAGRSAESRFALKGRMLRRGIPLSVAEDILKEYSSDSESASTLLLVKFRAELADKTPTRELNPLAARMTRFLAARGYDADTAEEEVRKVLEPFDGHE